MSFGVMHTNGKLHREEGFCDQLQPFAYESEHRDFSFSFLDLNYTGFGSSGRRAP